jgi:HAE1 family hydrophobic/amphiphilic exporter-1
MKISALAVSRPVTTGMFFLAVLVLGLVSLSRLAVDQLPDVTRPSVTVLTTYEGAAPEIVERMVTDPLEKALATLDGVKELLSLTALRRQHAGVSAAADSRGGIGGHVGR